MNLMKLSLDQVDDDPQQPRQVIEPGEVRRLALSMRGFGQQQPIIVYRRGKRYGILDGHRRVAALRLLKADVVAAIVLEAEPDAETKLIAQLTANCLRIDLSPLEKARAFQRLKQAKGWDNRRLADAIHLSEGMISQCLALLEAPEEVQAAVARGELPASTAYYVGRTSGEVRQRLLKEASQGTLTRAAAQAAAGGVRTPRPPRKRCVLELDAGVVTVAGGPELTLDDVAALLRKLQKEVRRGVAQGLDLKTFERVLADRRQAAGSPS